MDAFFHFIGVLAECVMALIVLTIVLMVIVYRMPDGSPPKKILRAVTKRVGATTAIALVGLPIQPIPEMDGLYDITGVIILVIYWYGLVGQDKISEESRRRQTPHIRSRKGLGSVGRACEESEAVNYAYMSQAKVGKQ